MTSGTVGGEWRNDGSPGGVPVVQEMGEVRSLSRASRRDGNRVGFVPTMGALHEGHLSLVDRARELSDVVFLSVFVNPTQFGPDEDYREYPRDLEGDRAAAAARGVDVVFAPPVSEMYPREPGVWVVPGPLGDRLDGASRPGHFRGVLTVVSKLFHAVEPEVAVFGRKDFQQSVLIRRMVADLNLPIQVETAPIVREEDGLAVSTRNGYLSAGERRRAVCLARALAGVRRAYAEGEREPDVLRELARGVLEAAGAEVDYVELVDPESLERVPHPAPPEAVCALAARVGDTRLIDNAPVTGPSSLEHTKAAGGD